MRTSRTIVAALALGIGLAAPLSAQGVAGSWRVTYDADITGRGDAITVKRRATGRLVLEQRGDSVFGRFTLDGGPDRSPVLRGTFDGRALTLTTGPARRTVTVNGTATEIVTRTDWMGVLDGAALRGTMFIAISDREPPARRWEATRESGPR